MNQFNQNFNQPQQQGRMLNVMLVPDTNSIDVFQINPGNSMLFLNESMTEMRMRTRDQNGFPLPERVWSIKETTPPQQTDSRFATRAEINELNDKMDKILTTLNEFMK